MNIKILALGKIKENYIKEGIDEFLKRLTPYTNLEIIEIPTTEIKDDNMISKALNDEAERILSYIKPQSYVVTLEIKGKEFSSEEFAQKIQNLVNDGINELIFIIGSSHGLSKLVSEKANIKISMSKMTFLHNFARLILIEQIYRAYKIMRGGNLSQIKKKPYKQGFNFV